MEGSHHVCQLARNPPAVVSSAPMPATLRATIRDTQANTHFEASFEHFPVRIGRNQLNDLPIDRPFISQFHVSIDVKAKRIFIKDHGSTNGTTFAGRKILRDTVTDITGSPEFRIGPIVLELALLDTAHQGAAPKAPDGELNDPIAASIRRPKKAITPGSEDPYLRQLVPYVEAYRNAWGAAYRTIYDHLMQLPQDARDRYLTRLANEHPTLLGEDDFQKIAQYYGVDTRFLGDPKAEHVAMLVLGELAKTIAPSLKAPTDVSDILAFGRRLRDTLRVFMKCFVSLRDGYREFESEVLARDLSSDTNDLGTAPDANALGSILLGGDRSRDLHDMFVDVMAHQVALMNGVMEGVKSLLSKLSPRAIEDELERRGKKSGIFSSKFEDLWKLYVMKHGDYSGEDKETFLTIFGPQFSRAYARAAGEEMDGSGKSTGATMKSSS